MAVKKPRNISGKGAKKMSAAGRKGKSAWSRMMGGEVASRQRIRAIIEAAQKAKGASV